MGLFEWESLFIKNNMTRNINTTSGWVHTPIAFMVKTLSKENTLDGLKLVRAVRAKPGVTRTPKYTQWGIVRSKMKESFIR